MKTRNILLLSCICVAAIAALVFAQEEPRPRSAPQRGAGQMQQRQAPARGAVGAPGERGRGPVADPNLPAAREDVLREAMARRMQVHQQEIAKLEAIVKIAEAEDATKTVEALKALIAEKDKEAKEQVEQAERRRLEMQQRLQERLGERATQRPAGAAPAGAGQARPEDVPRMPRQPQTPQRQRNP